MNNKFRLFSLVLFSCLLFFSVAALADPPFITDDAETVEYKHWEIFIYNFFNISKNATSLNAPMLELNYGLLPGFEIDATISALSIFPKPQFGANAVGFTDIDLQVKYRLVKEKKNIPEVSFVPYLIIPTGDYDRNLGNGRVWYLFPIAVEKNWDKWSTYASLGYAVNSAPGAQNYLFGGWVLQKEINDTWTVGGEIYGQQKSSNINGAYVLFNLGAFYKLSKNLDFIFNAGNNFIGQSNFIAGIGLDLTI